MRTYGALLISTLFLFSIGATLQNCSADTLLWSEHGDAATTQSACSVSGHVRNLLNSAPIKKATVSLRSITSGSANDSIFPAASFIPNGSPGGSQHSVLSANDGSFCFQAVQPGQYALSGRARGFLDTRYGAQSPAESGRNIIVGAQRHQDLTLALVPESVVSGKVVDPDGDPVSGAYVKLLMRRWVGVRMRNVPVQGGQTNDLGEFRVPNISPGSYYVVVEPGPENSTPDNSGRRLVRTFYPGTTTIDQATLISIHAGDEQSDIVVPLLTGQTHHVRGRVQGLSPSDRGALSLQPEDEEQVFIAAGSGTLKADGTFDFPNVSPGSYVLSYFQISGETAKGARQVISVGNDDVDIALALAGGATIQGHIRLDGTPSSSSESTAFQGLDLKFVGADALIAPRIQARLRADGSFVVSNIPPGRYLIETKAPAGTYLKSVLYGQSDVTNKILDFSDGGSGQMEIVYRYGAATVTGTISTPQNTENGGSEVAAGAHIVLIPQNADELDGRGVLFGEADASNSFSLKQVPPGSYRAYAFESIDLTALHEPAVLKRLAAGGTDVELKEGASEAVSLPLTSSAQERTLFASLTGQ
jgi:hypothetical protein